MYDVRSGKASRRFLGWDPIHAGLEARTLLSGMMPDAGPTSTTASEVDSVPPPLGHWVGRDFSTDPSGSGFSWSAHSIATGAGRDNSFDPNQATGEAHSSWTAGGTMTPAYDPRVPLGHALDGSGPPSLPPSPDSSGDPSGGGPANRGGPGVSRAIATTSRMRDVQNMLNPLASDPSEGNSTLSEPEVSTARLASTMAGRSRFHSEDPTPVLQAAERSESAPSIHIAYPPVGGEGGIVVVKSHGDPDAIARGSPEAAIVAVDALPADESVPETEVPAPIASDLILAGLPFDTQVWDEAVDRLVVGVGDLLSSLDDPGNDNAYLPWILAAGVALSASEAARFRRSRQSFAMAMVDGSVVEPADRAGGRSLD
jgi:hypothetical protein